MVIRHSLPILLVSILALGCGIIPVSPPPVASPQPSPIPTDAPTATPGPGPAWNLRDLGDSSRPALLTSAADGYALDPAWPVQQVEYVFKWWGLAKPIFDYQRLELSGSAYTAMTRTVPAQAVQALVQAINHLTPMPVMVEGLSHTDDYPSRAVELTGTDGQRILLLSGSTANPNAAPWNVLYNGKLYAQLDGGIGLALNGLFGQAGGFPAAAFFPGGQKPNTIVFASAGWPNQVIAGFNGLLPIADSFEYGFDPKLQRLRGTIVGRSSILGFGNMVIGTVTGLSSVRVGGDACAIDPIATADVAGAAWTFSCPLGPKTPASPRALSITVALSTDAGVPLTTTGALIDPWAGAGVLPNLSANDFIRQALATDPDARDLLSDHVIAIALFESSLATGTGFAKGWLQGDVVLRGSTRGPSGMRYTVTTPFRIQDGKLTFWRLSRGKLDALLKDAIGQPLVARARAAKPDAVLNVWYAEVDPARITDRVLLNEVPTLRGASLPACANPTGVTDIPTLLQPLRGFSLDSDWSGRGLEFALIGSQVVVAGLALDARDTGRAALLPVLAPRELRSETSTPFIRITTMRFRADDGEVWLYLDKAMPEAERAAAEALAAGLSLPVKRDDKDFWTIQHAWLAVGADGQLSLTACGK